MFDAGESQQHFVIWVTVVNQSSLRHNHKLALIVYENGIGCWDDTARENVF